MRKYLVVSVIVIFMLMAAGFVFGQDARRGNIKPSFYGLMDLTEDQQDKIRELTLQLKKEILPLRSEIQKYRSELRLELTAEKFDEARVKNLVEQISDLSKQIQLKRTMHQRAIRNLLTPDQQQKYDLHLLSGRKIERRRFDDRPRLMRDPDGPRPDRGFRNR